MFMTWKITTRKNRKGITIYINGLLHLWLEDITSIHAYMDAKSDGTLYHIEYTVDGQTKKIVTGYDKEEIWLDVLRELSRIV